MADADLYLFARLAKDHESQRLSSLVHMTGLSQDREALAIRI